MSEVLVGSGDSRVIDSGKMYVVFPDRSFYKTVKDALSEWFGMDIKYLTEALKLMEIKDDGYTIEELDVNQAHVNMQVSSKQGKYKLQLHRGDMCNPYPTWVLIDEDSHLRKWFGVEMKPSVALLWTDSDGQPVTK